MRKFAAFIVWPEGLTEKIEHFFYIHVFILDLIFSTVPRIV